MREIDWERGQIIYDMPDAEYRAVPALSGTELASLAESPAVLQHRRQTPWEPSRGAVLGSAVDLWLTGSEEAYRAHYVALPADLRNDRRTKAWQHWRAQHPEDVEILSAGEAAQVEGMVRAVQSHPWFHLWRPARKQVAVFWTERGTRCKGLMDAFDDDGEDLRIIDLKTTSSVAGFFRQARALRYDLQAAHYLSGVATVRPEMALDTTWYWLVVQSAPPHLCEMYALSDVDGDRADADREDLLALYQRCVEEDSWPSTSGEVQSSRIWW